MYVLYMYVCKVCTYYVCIYVCVYIYVCMYSTYVLCMYVCMFVCTPMYICMSVCITRRHPTQRFIYTQVELHEDCSKFSSFRLTSCLVFCKLCFHLFSFFPSQNKLLLRNLPTSQYLNLSRNTSLSRTSGLPHALFQLLQFTFTAANCLL